MKKLKEIRVEPSNEATLTNYTILNFLISGIAMSLMRGAAIVYSENDAEYIKLLSLFVIIGIGGSVAAGLLSDVFSRKHLLVLISVMLVCTALMFPAKYGMTLRVILMSFGYCIFKASAGASVIVRSKSGGIGQAGIFLSSGAVGMAFSIMRPVVGYYMLPVAMFIAAASDRDGMEYQTIMREKRMAENACSPKSSRGFSFTSLMFSALIIILSSVSAIGLFYLYFEKCMFWGAETKFGPIISALFFAIGAAVSGLLSDKAGKTAVGAVSPLISMACMLFSGVMQSSASETISKLLFLFGVFFVGFALTPILGFIRGAFPVSSGASLGFLISLECPAYFIACSHHIYRLEISQTSAVILIFAVSAACALLSGLLLRSRNLRCRGAEFAAVDSGNDAGLSEKNAQDFLKS